MPAPDRVPGHHCDNRLRAGAHLALEIKHVETVNALLILVTGLAANLLIAAGAKRLVPFAGENNHADLFIFPSVDQGLRHFIYGQRAERIANLRAIDRDFGDPLGFVVLDIGVGSGGFPIYRGHLFHLFSRKN